MPDDESRKEPDFFCSVGVREKRKIRARNKNHDEVWFGLGMFGVIGWSVSIPTVIGAFVGIWIDLKWQGGYSWTLMLIVLGLVTGYINSWFWIRRQRNKINENHENGKG